MYSNGEDCDLLMLSWAFAHVIAPACPAPFPYHKGDEAEFTASQILMSFPLHRSRRGIVPIFVAGKVVYGGQLVLCAIYSPNSPQRKGVLSRK